eukprot:TRINITY_DN943_c0_g1_i9.p5 TRINITY_DN943_c0_g1~~TRINITY_DN943_c0_g1_i9.p5  ORF type:complete len:104 (-),score=2.92 TRINITY_DN943_c0_g1_i9:276-587(-)
MYHIPFQRRFVRCRILFFSPTTNAPRNRLSSRRSTFGIRVLVSCPAAPPLARNATPEIVPPTCNGGLFQQRVPNSPVQKTKNGSGHAVHSVQAESRHPSPAHH